jgi:hypothetical protein
MKVAPNALLHAFQTMNQRAAMDFAQTRLALRMAPYQFIKKRIGRQEKVFD